MGIPRKTMRDIKTLSGRVDRIANPYMAYMQITCLEMEKARKGRERSSAMQRLENLDARLGDIEKEKASLLSALSQQGSAPAPRRGGSGSSANLDRRVGGFKIRY